MKVSENIKTFLDFLAEAKCLYSYCKEHQTMCEKLTQDLLHKIELEQLSRSELSKITTQLKHCRKDRRYFKDMCEELQDLIDLFSDGNGKSVENKLKNVLGSVRRAENYHKSRTYVPKIMRESEYRSEKADCC